MTVEVHSKKGISEINDFLRYKYNYEVCDMCGNSEPRGNKWAWTDLLFFPKENHAVKNYLKGATLKWKNRKE